ncbi:hypothetical protein [Salicibibacter cibarius]
MEAHDGDQLEWSVNEKERSWSR